MHQKRLEIIDLDRRTTKNKPILELCDPMITKQNLHSLQTLDI